MIEALILIIFMVVLISILEGTWIPILVIIGIALAIGAWKALINYIFR